MTQVKRYRQALDEILKLDLGRTPDGRTDFFTGPDRFFRAWLIAYKARRPNDSPQGENVEATGAVKVQIHTTDRDREDPPANKRRR